VVCELVSLGMDWKKRTLHVLRVREGWHGFLMYPPSLTHTLGRSAQFGERTHRSPLIYTHLRIMDLRCLTLPDVVAQRLTESVSKLSLEGGENKKFLHLFDSVPSLFNRPQVKFKCNIYNFIDFAGQYHC